MARKRTTKPRKYTIQHGKLQHQTSARRFTVWLRAGLIVLVNSHLAHVSDAARTRWENGELFLAPKAEPGPSIRTNAEVVDAQYIYANGGEIKVSREERIHFAELRFQLGDLAEQLIGDYLSRKREFDMRAQYGW